MDIIYRSTVRCTRPPQVLETRLQHHHHRLNERTNIQQAPKQLDLGGGSVVAARSLFIYIPDVATEKSVPPVLVSNKLLAEELDQYAKGKYCSVIL